MMVWKEGGGGRMGVRKDDTVRQEAGRITRTSLAM